MQQRQRNMAIEVIEIPIGSTKIRAFADSEIVLYCTKIDSEVKLQLNDKAWQYINSYVNNYRKESICTMT